MLGKLQHRMRNLWDPLGLLTRSNYKKYLKANRSNVLLWCSLLVFILFVYHFFSDGDFSFLLVNYPSLYNV